MKSSTTDYTSHSAAEGIDRVLLALGGSYGLAVLGMAVPIAVPLFIAHPGTLFGLCMLLLPLLICGSIITSFFAPKIGKALALTASILFPFTLVAWNMGWLGIENLGEPPTWAWGFLGSGIGVAAASMRGRWAYVHGLATAVLMILIPLTPGGQDRSWSQSMQDGLLALTLAVVVCEPFLALRRSAARTDAAHARVMAQYRSSEAQRVAEEQRKKVARIIHDQVLSSLRHASMERSGLNPSQLRSQVSAALEEVNSAFERKSDMGLFTPADLYSALVAKASAFQIVPSADGTQGSQLEIPKPSFDALIGASLEAIRNTASHAPHATVTVEINAEHHRVQIVVTDNGPGFDRSKIRANRRGIRDSIVARCLEAGCNAHFNSTPGQGVQVRLDYEGRPR